MDFLDKIFLAIISPLRSPFPFKKWLFQENKYRKLRSAMYLVRYLSRAKVWVSCDVETLGSRQNVTWASLYLFYFPLECFYQLLFMPAHLRNRGCSLNLTTQICFSSASPVNSTHFPCQQQNHLSLVSFLHTFYFDIVFVVPLPSNKFSEKVLWITL